jgi:hypothetical protein
MSIKLGSKSNGTNAPKFTEVGVGFAGKKNPEMISFTTDLEVEGSVNNKSLKKEPFKIQFTAWPIDRDAIVERKMASNSDKEKAAYKATLPLYRVYMSNEILAALDQDDLDQTRELKAQGELA